MHIGITTFVTDTGIAVPALARALEERGFESLYVSEHSHIPAEPRTPHPSGGELPAKYYRTLDPFVTLATAAALTSRLRVGTGVALVTQRDPIAMAKDVATLDLVSGGRFVLSVGVGWLREEIANHGTDPATRGLLADERIAAMIEIWTKETAEYHGRFVDFDPMYCWPKPLQQPYPPLYFGGSAAAFPRIARFSAGWHAIARSADGLEPRLRQLRALAGEGVPVTVDHVGEQTLDVVARYEALGVERVLLEFPTQPEEASLRLLDQHSSIVTAIHG